MELSDAILALSALAHDTRLRVFRLLARAGVDGLAAGDIADALDIPPPTLSFHLEKLTRAGLLEPLRTGRSIRYALRVERMQCFLAFLTEDCCQGHPELCLPAAVPTSRRVARPGEVP